MKVAIVGCKGSGKTVLMSVLGVKYEKPDKNGIFLNPKDKQTHRICNENVGRMQNDAKWPPATSPDAGYDWKDGEAMEKGDWSVVWRPNKDVGDRKTASKEGEWLTKCNQCDNGEKTVTCNVKCRECNGFGTTAIERVCFKCNGDGSCGTEYWSVECPSSSCIDGRTACGAGRTDTYKTIFE